MDQAVRRMRLLGLPGSLRKASELGAATEFEIRDLRLPLYNEDEDGADAPEIVRQFRRAIDQSDGIVIATPEYNHGIPGVLKNALDWASRPVGRSVLIEKPVLVMSVSPAFTGGVRAQAQIHETLLAIPARIVTPANRDRQRCRKRSRRARGRLCGGRLCGWTESVPCVGMGRIQIAYVRAFGSGISVARQAAQARRNFSPTQSGPDLARTRQAWTGLLLRRRVGTQNRLGF